MQDQHVPGIGRYYWPAFAVSTVFGSAAGDLMVSSFAGWSTGNLHLPLMMAFFLGILVAEGLDRTTTRAWYWLAVVIAPIVSNDLADLSFKVLGVQRIWLGAAMVVVLVVAHMAFQSDVTRIIALRLQQRPSPTVPLTDATYWIALLVASTAGTLASDFLTVGHGGLGPPATALLLTLPVAAAAAARRWTQINRTWTYWSVVVALNGFGNAVSKLLAGQAWLGLGLSLSVILSGAVLALLVFLASRHDVGVRRPG